jgi:hypothetical protein
MCKCLILISILLLAGCAETFLFTSDIALTADWMLTRKISGHYPDSEGNVIMGKHPSLDQVNLYFGSCILLNTAAYPFIPEKLRPLWYGGLTIFESIVVNHNISAGLRF